MIRPDLLNALKIQKTNVLGYFLGSFIAQQFAIVYPDKDMIGDLCCFKMWWKN